MNIRRDVAFMAAVHDMEPVEGDLLPPIGERVKIHLGRQGMWVEHTVIGYYVWPDLGGDETLFRVFVRVVDDEGFENARLLQEVQRENTPQASIS